MEVFLRLDADSLKGSAQSTFFTPIRNEHLPFAARKAKAERVMVVVLNKLERNEKP